MSSLLHFDAAIRADDRAETAARAFLCALKGNRTDAPLIQRTLRLDPPFRTNPHAQQTTLAFFFID